MDSIEVGRQRAERLHADAVASRHDPLALYAFARAEAIRRNLKVAKIPKGDYRNFLRGQPAGAGLPITRLLERIRRLVLHPDDRDLRQLPTAARGMDAVRLMTIHGSKGLEFPVVHIPGLTNGSLPRSPKASLSKKTIPPDGMIEGAEGTATDAVSAAMIEEQECLFFVALSRARDWLLLYSPTKKSNGHNWSLSPFIDRISRHLSTKHVVPVVVLPATQTDALIPFTIDGPFRFSDHQLALYQRCPRRFLYTHILEVGGRRKETAFMQLHVAVQKVVDAASLVAGQGPSMKELETYLEVVWEGHGPADLVYSDEYRRIAQHLIRYYAGLVAGVEALPVPQLRLPVPGGEIVITPHQMVNEEGGHVVMRRVNTGHKLLKDEESLSAAAFSIAATAHTPSCSVELVYLSDAAKTRVAMTP